MKTRSESDRPLQRWDLRCRAWIVLGAGLALLTPGALAQTAPATAPPGEVVVATLDADTQRRMDTLADALELARQQHHIPGMAVAVVKDGKVVLARGFGQRDLDNNLPVRPDTIFGIGSQTKAFTSMLCAMLVSEGAMRFDDPITTHLPTFELSTPEWTSQVTVRDALSHRTGLQRTDLLWAAGKVTRAEAIAQLKNAKPFAPMRTAFLYSNLMFMAAGDAAANAAKSPDWETLVKQRIFDPLGMTSTTAYTHQARGDGRVAKGYSFVKAEQRWEPLPMRVLDACGPAGSINSNVLDMTRWIRFLLDRGVVGGTPFVDAKLFDSDLWSQQMGIMPETSYGLGWFLGTWNGKRVVHHGGNIDGYACMLALLPDDNAGFVLLANVTASPLQDVSRDMVWNALFGDGAAAPAPAAYPPEDELRKLAGRYDFAPQKSQITALVQDGKLALDVPGQTVYALKPPNDKGRWVFELTDAIEVSFKVGPAGVPESMTMYQAGMEFVMPRLEGDPPTVMTPAELAAITAPMRRGEPPRAFRITGTADYIHSGLTGQVVMAADGDRWMMRMDFGKFGRIAMGFDGEASWSDSDISVSRVLTGQEAAQVRGMHPRVFFSDPTLVYAKVEPRAIEPVRGEETVRTVLTPAGAPPTTVWFDRKTGRPVREEIGMVSEDMGLVVLNRVGYTDWTPLGNAEFPATITMDNQFQGRLLLKLDVAGAEVGERLPPEATAIPATVPR